MRTTLTAVAAAATIAVATIAAPTAADARRGWWAPAIIGGLAAGAIIGSAYARPYYGGYGYYQPAPVYDGYAPAYYGGYSAGAGKTAIAIGCADDHGFLPRIAEPRPAAPSGPPAFFASSSTVSWPRTDQNSDKLPRLCTSS